MGAPTARGRSASITPSERSSKSRITLVGDDPSVATYHEPRLDDDYHVSTTYTQKFSWFDHLCQVFCIPRSGESTPIMAEKVIDSEHHWVSKPARKCREAMGLTINQVDDSASPWVLPVFVLSTRKGTDKNDVPKRAKCTIDTGNMQGNIVSREFVVEVLGFSDANFHELTASEKEGGAGVTGDKLIPEGAIYLTWYHNKSTRVFRNMRFLISPHPHYDLIIGARSIQKHNLLDVPNLMTGRGEPGVTIVRKQGVESMFIFAITGTSDITKYMIDEHRQSLRDSQYSLERDKKRIEKALEKAEEQNDDARTKTLRSELAICNKNLSIATGKLELCKAEEAHNKPLVEKLQEDLNVLMGVHKPASLPSASGATTSTGVSPNKASHFSALKKTLTGKKTNPTVAKV